MNCKYTSIFLDNLSRWSDFFCLTTTMCDEETQSIDFHVDVNRLGLPENYPVNTYFSK